ncbi:LAFA_0B00694g1_1 [Lachancea sp. 'fantastica']|nr:LAFA_0B00694g1_1 [Lachancea sp. 'fantastica']
MNPVKIFKYPNQKNVPENLNVKIKEINDENDIKNDIIHKGDDDCASQYLVVKNDKHFLKDTRLAFNYEKEIREKEIKYVNRDDYDRNHSEILVCYANEIPDLKYNIIGNDTIKFQKIDIPILEYKTQLCEKYNLYPPYYYTMYYIDPENRLFCTSCTRSDDCVNWKYVCIHKYLA